MLTDKEVLLVKEKLSFFNELTNVQKEYLLSNAGTRSYHAKDSLKCSACKCIGLALVKSGSIRTYIISEDGREVTLYRLAAGDVCILSAACVIKTIMFDVAMEAENDCEVIQISPSVVAKLINENIHAELYSYKLATERFSDVMWAIQEVLFTSFDKRLAAFLLNTSENTNSDTIHMTHEQIARYLGSAREVVSRMLKYFSSEGAVSLFRGGVEITGKDILKKLAGQSLND